jgi:hypothetical protein
MWLCKSFLAYLLLCDFPLIVFAYSRQHRVYHLKSSLGNLSNSLIIRYDPILQDLTEIATQLCSLHSCSDINQLTSQLRDQYETKLDEDIEIHLGSRYSHHGQGDGSLWLHQSDLMTQSSYETDIKLKNMIANVLGNPQPSLSSDFISRHLRHPFPGNQWSLENFEILGKKLFEKEKFFLCFNLCERLYRHLYQSQITFQHLRSLILLTQILSFSSSLMNELHLSTLFTLKILYLYQQYDRVPLVDWPFTSASIDGITAVHRLRLLLLLPPLPHTDLFTSSLYSKSKQSLVHYRHEMEEDLQLFIHDLVQRQITASLLVDLSFSSCPLNLSLDLSRSPLS